MRRIHLIGRKNSGKTMLVVELIELLTQRGLKVGTIKHTGHAYELDTPGKDSHRHRQAGSVPAAIIAGPLMGVYLPSDDAYEKLNHLYNDCDLVIVEGDNKTNATKIEIWRSEVSEEPMAASDSNIRAIISDDQPNVRQPIWPRNNVSELADKICELAGLS